MNQFYRSLPQSERERVDSLEYFDEYEEWRLKCNHYVIVVARHFCEGKIPHLDELISSVNGGCNVALGLDGLGP